MAEHHVRRESYGTNWGVWKGSEKLGVCATRKEARDIVRIMDHREKVNVRLEEITANEHDKAFNQGEDKMGVKELDQSTVTICCVLHLDALTDVIVDVYEDYEWSVRFEGFERISSEQWGRVAKFVKSVTENIEL